MDKMTESYAKPEAVAFSWLLVWPWWEWVPLQTPPKVEVLVVDCDDCPYLLLHTLLLHMAISYTCCFEKEMDEHDSVTSALICSVLLMLTSRLSCLPYAKWGNWSRKDVDRSLAFAGSLGYLLTRAVGSWETRACAPSTGVILLGQAQRNWECFEECCHDNRVFSNRRVLSSRKFGRISPENNPWTQISNGK